jgi:membrane associated rhomboid family serine protease
MSQEGNRPSYRLKRPGGDVDRGRVFNAPGVVLLIAGATIAAFVILGFLDRDVRRVVETAGAVIPAVFMGGSEANNGVLSMLSPLIAHMFLHGGIMHLLMNTFFLLAFGTPVARRMGAEGALQSSSAFAAASMFATFYLLSGVAGALLFIALHADQYIFLVGASGGVSGLLGGLVRFAFNRSTLFGPEEARTSPLLSRPVLAWTTFILAFNNPVGAALLSPIAGGASIAWEAHLGGYFFGLLTYPFFERAARGFR